MQSQVTIQQPPDSVKDYVALADVVRLLPLIATQGRQRLYNLGVAATPATPRGLVGAAGCQRALCL